MPGRLLCGGESGCSSRKALPGPRSYAPSTSSSSCWSGLLRIYHHRSERYTQTGKTHDICICSFFFTIDTSGRARGCCAGVLRRRAGGPRGVHKLSRHATNSLLHFCLASFCHEGRYFSPLHEGRALCFARHVSAHHSMLPLV